LWRRRCGTNVIEWWKKKLYTREQIKWNSRTNEFAHVIYELEQKFVDGTYELD
jgi:hypothetical protein